MDYKKIHNKIISNARDRTANRIYQRHHIVPRHAGGDNSNENLVYLSFKEHYVVHGLLWKIFKSEHDLHAHNIMKGIKTDEAHKFFCVLGGKIQGKRNAESGHMIKIKTKESMTKAGKAAAEKNRIRGVGAFYNKEAHAKAAALGGKAQGIKNAASGHLKTISALSKRNTGQFWITNGIESKMTFGTIPTGWRKGRVWKRKING